MMVAEEKLLNLIRKNDNSLKAKPAQPNKIFFDISKKNTVTPGEIFQSTFHVFIIILILGFLATAGYKYFNNSLTLPIGTVLQQADSTEDNNTSVLAVLSADVKPFESYKQVITTKNIFLLPWEEVKSDSPATPTVVTTALSDLVKIKGIVLDQDPKVILEDVNAKQVLILSEGETVAGAIVGKILADKVIFKFNNQETELAPQ